MASIIPTTTKILNINELQERLCEYENAGWINIKEYNHYTQLLLETNVINNNEESLLYREQITLDLQRIAYNALQTSVTTKITNNTSPIYNINSKITTITTTTNNNNNDKILAPQRSFSSSTSSNNIDMVRMENTSSKIRSTSSSLSSENSSSGCHNNHRSYDHRWESIMDDRSSITAISSSSLSDMDHAQNHKNDDNYQKNILRSILQNTKKQQIYRRNSSSVIPTANSMDSFNTTTNYDHHKKSIERNQNKNTKQQQQIKQIDSFNNNEITTKNTSGSATTTTNTKAVSWAFDHRRNSTGSSVSTINSNKSSISKVSHDDNNKNNSFTVKYNENNENNENTSPSSSSSSPTAMLKVVSTTEKTPIRSNINHHHHRGRSPPCPTTSTIPSQPNNNSNNDNNIDDDNNTIVKAKQSNDNYDDEVSILEINDLQSNNNHNNNNIIGGVPRVQELFVEMCFFARLGFIQPPCCLQCTYNESIKKQIDQSKTCHRWVIWRKDAGIINTPMALSEEDNNNNNNTLQTTSSTLLKTTLLRPDTLDGNIILIKCHAVKQLLNGNIVNGRLWDRNIKKLVSQNTDVNTVKSNSSNNNSNSKNSIRNGNTKLLTT